MIVHPHFRQQKSGRQQQVPTDYLLPLCIYAFPHTEKLAVPEAVLTKIPSANIPHKQPQRMAPAQPCTAYHPLGWSFPALLGHYYAVPR